MRFYTEDQAVIGLGAEYLRIFGWSYPFLRLPLRMRL
jgi:Na+-driven multidrug efflux pump